MLARLDARSIKCNFLFFYYPITIPDLGPATHIPCASSRLYGDIRQKTKKSLLLIVPSVVAREEPNVLINPQHPEFLQITDSLAGLLGSWLRYMHGVR